MTDVRSNVHVQPLAIAGSADEAIETAPTPATGAKPAAEALHESFKGVRAFATATRDAHVQTANLKVRDSYGAGTALQVKAEAQHPKRPLLRLSVPTVGGALAATGAIALGLTAWPLVIAAGAGLALTAAASESGFRALRGKAVKSTETLLLTDAGSAGRTILEAQRDSVRDATEPTYASAAIVAGAERMLVKLDAKTKEGAPRVTNLTQYRELFAEIAALAATIPAPMLATARRADAIEHNVAKLVEKHRTYDYEYDDQYSSAGLTNAIDALPPEELVPAAADILHRLFPRGELSSYNCGFSDAKALYARLREITGEALPASTETFHPPATTEPSRRCVEEGLHFWDTLEKSYYGDIVKFDVVDRASARALSPWVSPLERSVFADIAERYLATWKEENYGHYDASQALAAVIQARDPADDVQGIRMFDAVLDLIALDRANTPLKEVDHALRQFADLPRDVQRNLAPLVIDRLFAKPATFAGHDEVFREMRQAQATNR